MPRARLLLFASVLAGTCASTAAEAQTIAPDAIGFPVRFVGGENEGYFTRAENFDPYGISYADCISDMTLQFTVVLAGFEDTDASVEVWASTTSDCVAKADRGIGSTSAVCWGVSPSLIEPNTSGSTQFNVRVEDLVGWQSSPPSPANAMQPPSKTVLACAAQPSFAAVPMVVNFLAVDGNGNSVGTPYQYSIETDMVGPPSPAGLCETAGQGLLNLSFTPNTDSDTAGYDLYVDPIPSQVPTGETISPDSGSIVVCPDASSNAADGGCYTLATGSSLSPDSGNCATSAVCNDPILTGAVLPDAGSTPDEASAGGEGGVETGNGGISSIPDAYLFNLSSGLTMSDRSTAQYAVTGLVDYVAYTVVIAAVDGTGNIGPPSSEVCDYPAPVNDFWQNYEQDGGGKGGYCALETVGVGGTSLLGVGCAVVVLAVTRRRRKRRPLRAPPSEAR
jgi:hypothetical protein